MQLEPFSIKSKFGDYTVEYASIHNFSSFMEKSDLLLIDRNVHNHFSSAIIGNHSNTERMIIIDAVEEVKNIEHVIPIIERIVALGVTKKTRVVAVGGGIVQDISGFIASVIYRGLPWVYFPTTLLAQCDSCIGAKTSLNIGKYKNILGTFYSPKKVFIHPEFLNTLEYHDFLSGMGEAVKLHLIKGRDGIAEILSKRGKLLSRDEATVSEIARNSLIIKKNYIEQDEFDIGIRNLLNYGHCIGHAIESATGYEIPHGQAVIVGMILANEIGFKKSVLGKANKEYIESNFLYPFLDKKFHKKEISITLVIDAMKNDKKRVGENLVVVYPDDQFSFIKDVDIDSKLVIDSISEWNERASKL